MTSLINFLWIIFYTNVITFGNGPVMLPLFAQSLVQNMHMISQEQLLYAYSIGRVTPGQVNLYIAAIGYLTHGYKGAFLSTLVLVIPGYLILPMVHIHNKLKEITLVEHLIKGITVVSIGLMIEATVTIGQGVLTSVVPWIVFATVIILAKVVKVNGFLSFVLASALGIILYYLPLLH
ncbi:MAG TPA: chromate transporter [Patescibacteria group bacterium]|nr:chromate transporter [Patescibacteria group bacterium]